MGDASIHRIPVDRDPLAWLWRAQRQAGDNLLAMPRSLLSPVGRVLRDQVEAERAAEPPPAPVIPLRRST